MSELLEKKYRDQLVTWIGRPCHFRLLYKISRDGCSAQSFHQKCDGQGPTVTVLYNTNNTIFGGYLSQSWNSSGGYINDPSGFLFRLQYNGSSNPLKFPASNANYAGYGHSSYGPMFGSGHDINTFSGTINKSGNYFPLNGYVSNIGATYNLNGQNSNSITNNNLQVTDLEVYKVEGDHCIRSFSKLNICFSVVFIVHSLLVIHFKDGPEPVKKNVPDSVLLDKPWRKFPEFSTEVKYMM